MQGGLLLHLITALCAAVVGAAVALRLRQPVIVGYIVAGIVIGPFTPGIMGDTAAIAELAEVGIIFLMFVVGAQLSLRELVRDSRLAIVGGLLQVAVMIALGFAIGRALGWGSLEAYAFGAVVSNSSSTVLGKVLLDRGELDSRHARIGLAWSSTSDAPDDLPGTSSPTSGAAASTSSTSAAASTSSPSTTSASSTGDPSAGEASSSTGELCNFICPLDMVPEVPGCDGGWDDPCPEGQKCTAYGGSTWEAMKCVPVMADPAQPGEDCFVDDGPFSGIDNCDVGAMCWNLDAGGNGVCVAHCHDGDALPTCTDPATLCYLANDGVLSLCLTRCDPLLQDCARAQDVCVPHPNGDGFFCAIDVSGEGGAVYSPCEHLNACDDGFACVNSSPAAECDKDAPGCCLPFCDLAAADPNAPCTGVGQQCVPYFDPDLAPPGDEDVGVCAIPP